LTIESEDYKTTFVLQKAKRPDTGIYTITAKNDSGSDKADVEIVVLSELTAAAGLPTRPVHDNPFGFQPRRRSPRDR